MQKNEEKRKRTFGGAVPLIISVICAAAYFGVYIRLCSQGKGTTLWGFALLWLYLATTAVLCICWNLVRGRRAPLTAREEENMSEITRDLLVRFSHPSVICDAAGRIMWHNDAFVKLYDGQAQLGRNIEEITTVDYKKAQSSVREDGVICMVGEHTFAARAYVVRIEDKRYNVVVFTDNTELYAAWKKIFDEETQLAYVVIDNLSDLQQFASASSRSASMQVENILSGWAESVGGIIKEYERDKFLFVFHKKHLAEFSDDKFDIINKIREVRVGEAPVTVSIGVSAIDGSLTEKENAARSALEMALQRGGDQAAVKYPTEMLFFGGKTKTVQKRTKVRARVFATELVNHISSSGRVLVMGHLRPDMDCLGACLGIAELARFCGVAVNIVADKNDANTRKYFEALENDPEWADTVIDSQEALEINTSDTLLVIVDVNNRDFFESPDLFVSAGKVVVIDHHIKKADYKTTFSYIEPSASSACELVSEMLEQVLPDGYLSKEEADILLSGMLLDTRMFTRNTGARTFGAAQYLRNQGAVPSDAKQLFSGSFDEFAREARFQGKMKMYREHLVIAVNDAEDNTPADRVTGAKVADKLLDLEGVQASFAMLRIGEDVYISARSEGKINVQIIMGHLGGGGAYDSSAAQLRDTTLEDAAVALKEAIDKYYSED